MELPTHIVATGGLILNDKDEVLLVNHPMKGWEFPGGIVELGETIPQALLREIKEESGVDVKIVNIVGIYSNTKKKKGYNGVKEIPTIVNVDFICQYVSGELATSIESIEVRWYSKLFALQIINPRQKLRLEKMLNHQSEFTCIGFSLGSENQVNVNEEYIF